MLDTYARKHVQPAVDKTADYLLKKGWTADGVTKTAFAIGLSSGVFIYLDQPVLALIALWLSGFLDVVDGTMARKTKPSPWGTLLDISFDRLVEISVILGLAFRFPDSMWALLLLSASIIVAMTVFLTVGALSEKQGMKSFYYQAGLAERTEGFILFTLMIVFSPYLTAITLLFIAVQIFTIFQRMAEAKRILS
ncbi:MULTISPECIES: CDP-alcohol phosphatidyltransferase family protein [unclassified Planococcus (in: firmicutes)]|uniref:CDP-alcohol phosphatidyltransferase family protein n=1 Tax=Planococcus TaxID=1372 RepID=UPI000C33C640|nr:MULTISPECIES: CDP-alcohol phosphatidyltransferase family protein [unclassified Planococcus (in: firmicutes)]AUD13864.1 CDP-alcohol phosphatidyltransferase family protein [Planococcus sp. MB-3u-03]PKG45629.1 CDP-alcohol phosphatidyltransferase family protein [Planococcus sp. Urea-trap-24]PKG88662.1 CDP-alcohol phosphatidyltransferase family protein [Planococcus sp. Urea-3u-39]PKH38620.1 CDP-alcohol phosphatidyltransferase family protein [Planococcus sp. MB-3u-09]